MNPSEWLEKNVLGFSLLSAQEREAIRDFSLLWSFYEGTILNASGSANVRCVAPSTISSEGILTEISPFTNCIYDPTTIERWWKR